MIHNRKRNRWYLASVSLLLGCLLSPLFFPAVLFADPIKAFPDAKGWAAYTPGGRGGKIIRVTNLKARGPGSFAAAVRMEGRRIIVFEVGGVIDLQKNSIAITEPFLTIAGARPWDRNAIDKRIIRESREGAGKTIDSEQEVGGYPATKETQAPFDPNKWNLATMEPKEN